MYVCTSVRSENSYWQLASHGFRLQDGQQDLCLLFTHRKKGGRNEPVFFFTVTDIYYGRLLSRPTIVHFLDKSKYFLKKLYKTFCIEMQCLWVLITIKDWKYVFHSCLNINLVSVKQSKAWLVAQGKCIPLQLWAQVVHSQLAPESVWQTLTSSLSSGGFLTELLQCQTIFHSSEEHERERGGIKTCVE